MKLFIFISFLLMTVTAFSQNQQENSDKLTEDVLVIENEELKPIVLVSRIPKFKILDKNGEEIKYITTTDSELTRKAYFAVEEYDKKKQITNRADYIYTLNESFEVIEAKKIED